MIRVGARNIAVWNASTTSGWLIVSYFFYVVVAVIAIFNWLASRLLYHLPPKSRASVLLGRVWCPYLITGYHQ